MTVFARMAALFLAALLPLQAAAQDIPYPEHTVRIVVPFPAGGYYDRVGRVMAEALQASLKRPVVIENRSGATGMIGTEFVAKAPPDGYTLLLGSISGNVIAPLLEPRVRYDSLRDFAPVALLTSAPNVLVVSSSSNVRTFNELAAMIRAKNGGANYASNGNGGTTHLAMEALKAELGLDIQHIPFQGSAPAVSAMIGGHVDASFASVLDVIPAIQANRLRAIAVGSPQRVRSLPDVPTFNESLGVPFESTAWGGLMAPLGTPPDVLHKLNAHVNRALSDPAIVKQLSPAGELEILGGTPEQFGTLLQAEWKKWGTIIKEKGITAQ